MGAAPPLPCRLTLRGADVAPRFMGDDEMSRDNLDLPWSFDMTDGIEIRDCDGGKLIIQPHEEPDFVDLWSQQVKLIVRAVNHHEALVEIVRVLTQEETDDPVTHMVEYGDASKRARSILAALDADNA